MRGVLQLYLIIAFLISLIVTLLDLMGVTDAPLLRMWAFWFFPWLIELACRLADWLDYRNYP
jgi:hypothetical protein